MRKPIRIPSGRGRRFPSRPLSLTALVALSLLLAGGIAQHHACAQETSTEKQAADDAVTRSTEPPRELQIAADSVDMQLQKGKVNFSGNVVVIDRGLRIESAALDVLLNDAGEMTEAVFTGHVTLRQEKEDREAAAERAVYDMTQGELVLTGKPVLRAGDRTLRNAKTIIYNRITERIRTEGTRAGNRPTLTIPLAPASGDSPNNSAE